MSDITLSQAQFHLQNWMTADTAVATGQSYSIGGRSLTRVDSKEIRESINYWSRVESQLQRIANGQSGIGRSVARFD